jgi:hypothetical protein
MDDEALDDLVRRLTALIVKIDERDTHMAARLERYDALLEEQREFNRQQVAINADVRTTLARLETLTQEVFRTRQNGHED